MYPATQSEQVKNVACTVIKFHEDSNVVARTISAEESVILYYNRQNNGADSLNIGDD
jgi:hypothetical protein